MSESNHFLLNAKNLRITIYISLAIANMLFGALYPDSIVMAACGFAFFAALALINLRPDDLAKNDSGKKLVHIEK
jgi:hypothetical protein